MFPSCWCSLLVHFSLSLCLLTISYVSQSLLLTLYRLLSSYLSLSFFWFYILWELSFSLVFSVVFYSFTRTTIRLHRSTARRAAFASNARRVELFLVFLSSLLFFVDPILSPLSSLCPLFLFFISCFPFRLFHLKTSFMPSYSWQTPTLSDCGCLKRFVDWCFSNSFFFFFFYIFHTLMFCRPKLMVLFLSFFICILYF